MNTLFTSIVQRLLVLPVLEENKETSMMYEASYQCKGFQDHLPTEDEICIEVGKDDIVCLTILEAEEITISYRSHSTEQTWESFTRKCSEITYSEDVPLTLKIKIEKRQKVNVLHIYDYESFYKELSTKQLKQFLEIWNDRMQSNIMVFVHSDEFVSWHTPTIYFQKSSENSKIIEHNYDRSLIYDRTNRLVYSEFAYRNILPLDFELSSFDNISDPIAKLFAVAYFYYTLSSIFDFSSFANNHIKYKINGFKTREFTVPINLADLQISIPNVKILSEIYNWIYLEGNTYDKMIIARNIISINLVDGESINFTNSTFSAIQSNFRYYSKENVKNFITLRNEISKILLDQENKIASFVSDFASDFKKSILPSITFFISVIAIRAISHQEIFDGFSPNIMKISILLVGLSLINLLYSLFFELNRKLHYSEQQIKDIKERYSKLLTEEEIADIFHEGDNCKKRNCFIFARKQRRYSVYMWVVCIFLMSAFLCWIGLDRDLKKTETNEHNIEYVDSVKRVSPIIDNVQVKTTCDTLKTDTNSLNNERLKKSPNSVCNQ